MASTLASLALSVGYDEDGADLEVPTPVMRKGLCVRIIVMITCVLSMVGASLIILSFAFCRDLRSKGRQVLLNISIMDLGVGLSNLVGAWVNFDGRFNRTSCTNCTTYPNAINTPVHCTFEDEHVFCPERIILQHLCFSQACLSAICTFGSILWTNALCFYLYLSIAHSGSKAAHYSLYASYLLCYGIPLFLTVWLALTGRFGYSPYESSGWCSIILMHPMTKERDIFASVFGYNLWILLTFIFVPVLSCSVHMSVKNKAKNTAIYRRSDKFMLALLSIDYKFLAIPLAFILLRVWSFVADVLHLYIGMHHLSKPVSLTLIVLGGIGDSGQGITNAIIFLFFTNKFKDTMKGLCQNIGRNSGMSIQTAQGARSGMGEDKSLLDDSTSADDHISPHHFTYQSYENSTPLEGSLAT